MVSKNIKIHNFTVLILFVFVFSFSAKAALEITNANLNPSVIWIHKNPELEISAKCKFDGNYLGNATLNADIYNPDSTLIMSPTLSYDSSSGKYLYRFQPSLSRTGKYKVNITCQYSEQETSVLKEFEAHKLELSILKDKKPIIAYMGEELTFYVEFKKDNALVSPSQNSFKVYLGKFSGSDKFSEKLEQMSFPVIKENYQEITVKIPLRSDDISEGIYDLRVVGYENGESITEEEKEFIKVNTPLKITIVGDEIKCIANEVCKQDLLLRVVFSAGSIEDFSSEENVEAIIIDKNAKGKKIYVEGLDCDSISNTCTLKLDIPSTLKPESYDLFITVAYPSISDPEYESKDSIPLEIVLELSGKIEDASGNVVETKFTLENIQTGKTISGRTGSSGEYSMEIIPGEYDMELKFSDGVTAKFFDVEISSEIILSENFIRYDKGHLNSKTPGIRMVRIVVIEFGLPFKNSKLYIPYDSSKVYGDENDLSVYRCARWNFKKSVCTGEWEEVEKKVYTIRDALELDTDFSGAFIIGEKQHLHFSNVELKTDKVYMGKPVTVVGKVVDADGRAAEGIVVISSFPRFNISRSTLTGAGGLFTAEINTPYVEGPVDLKIEAKNEPYVSSNKTMSINVLRSKELSIVGIPDVVEVNLNEEKLLNLKLFNSGQTNFTEPIYIHITGISSDWYELTPFKINSLGINEQKDISLRIKLTSEICGGKCPKYALVHIEAKSDEISKVMSFTLNILGRETQKTKTQEENETIEKESKGEGFSFNLPNITGFVSKVQVTGSSTNYLFLTVIVILLILILTKKKEGGGRRRGGIREPVTEPLHKIKLKI
jgi:hypothetical protein